MTGEFPLGQLNGVEASRPMYELDSSRLVRPFRERACRHGPFFAKRNPIKGLALVGLDLDPVSLCFVLHEAFSFRISAECDDQLQPIDSTRMELIWC